MPRVHCNVLWGGLAAIGEAVASHIRGRINTLRVEATRAFGARSGVQADYEVHRSRPRSWPRH